MRKESFWKKGAHEVRATQAMLQYGVGAMVDFPEQTLVTANPETWEDLDKIYDERFAKSLGVSYFARPNQIAYSRFPEWYFCPRCRKFQMLQDWILENKRRNPNHKDQDMVNQLRCPECRQDLVVSRIVTICENGHLNDFPWNEWVHVNSRTEPCAGNPKLQFKTGAASSEGLEGLVVVCTRCGAKASLKGAFSKDCFEKLDEKSGGEKRFLCKGNHPFKRIHQECVLYPRATQRGSSSVYFPLTYSSLVIPPYSNELRSKIEHSQQYNNCEIILADADDERERRGRVERRIKEWANEIAEEIGAGVDGVLKILTEKWLDNDGDGNDVSSVNYRIQEYEALAGKVGAEGNDGDFVRTVMDASLYELPFIKTVSLIEKVRIVTALVGFSRINPVKKMSDKGFVSIKKRKTNWYPANEVKGEGIFIEFDQGKIKEWIKQNPRIVKRAELLTHNYAQSFVGNKHARTITPKFLMLHTLSHLLISQLSFECGYNVASLGERIYCSEEDDGYEMAGIFIYTSSGDAEGTLGGLVRQGKPDMFSRIFRKAVKGAKVCSNDPVCIMSHGQGRESLNLAACYSCALLPETSCEERNALLDRAMIVGTYEEPQIGFWSKLANGSDWTRQNGETDGQTPSGSDKAEADEGDKGGERKSVKYLNGAVFLDDFDNWEDFALVIESFNVAILGENRVPLPEEYNGEFVDGRDRAEALASWPSRRVAIVEEMGNTMKDLAKQEGWKIFETGKINMDELRRSLKE